MQMSFSKSKDDPKHKDIFKNKEKFYADTSEATFAELSLYTYHLFFFISVNNIRYV